MTNRLPTPWPLLAALLSPVATAMSGPPAPAPLPAQLSARFATLAQQRPRPCEAGGASTEAPPGWRSAGAQCAWRGLLQVRYWTVAADAMGTACVSPQARWWAWTRQRIGGGTGAAWHHDWQGNAMAGVQAGLLRYASIAPSGHGGWVATEWRWSPSTRPATRLWQQGRWQAITASGPAAPARSAAPMTASLAEPVVLAWERNLHGRPAEVTSSGLLWEADHACLRLLPVAPTEMPFQLATNRTDVRLEQLAAMQVQLARRFPDARWLVPFRVLDDTAQASGNSVKYEALWSERGSVTGQLWIPAKDRDALLRVRVSAAVPDDPARASAERSSIAIGDSVRRELSNMARLLGERHDR